MSKFSLFLYTGNFNFVHTTLKSNHTAYFDILLSEIWNLNLVRCFFTFRHNTFRKQQLLYILLAELAPYLAIHASCLACWALFSSSVPSTCNHHVPKCMSCYKAIVVITRRAHCFQDILCSSCFCEILAICVSWVTYDCFHIHR